MTLLTMVDARLGLQDTCFAESMALMLSSRRSIRNSRRERVHMRGNVVNTHCAIIVANEKPRHGANFIVARWQMVWGRSKCEVGEEYCVVDGSMQSYCGGPIGFRRIQEGTQIGG